MPIIKAPAVPTHELPGAKFTALASPSRCGAETSVWTVELSPGAPGATHQLTRGEVFVVLSGRARVELAGEASSAGPGDAIVVPRDTPFALSAEGAAPLRAVCCLPVGGQARLADGKTFTPPWAE